MSTSIDSYGSANYSASSTAATPESRAQSFTTPSSPAYKLVQAKFYVYTDTGNVTTRAKLFAHSGTFGTNSVPTGSALATSSDVVVNEASSTWITYTFSTPYNLDASTNYCIAIEAEADVGTNFKFGYDGTSPTHGGNYSSYTGVSWSASNARDLIFDVLCDLQVTTYYQTCTNTVKASHTLSKSISIIKADTVKASHTLVKNINVSKNNTVKVSHGLIKGISIIKSNTVDTSNNISNSRVYLLTLNNTVKASHGSLTKDIYTNLNNTVNISHGLMKDINFILNNTVNTSHGLIKAIDIIKANTVNTSNGLIKGINIIKSNTVNTSHELTKNIDAIKNNTVKASHGLMKDINFALSNTVKASHGLIKAISITKANTVDTSNLILMPVTRIIVLTNTVLTSNTTAGVIHYMPIGVIVPTVTPNYFQKNRIESFKYELLTLSGGKYVSSGYINDYVNNCSISIDNTRNVIGNCRLSLRNNEDINYLSDLIRPWYIINDLYEFPMGTYLLSTPPIDSDGILLTRDINGYDLLMTLEQDKTITSTVFAAGENVVECITDILDSVGIWVKYDIVANDAVLSNNVGYELGKSKLFIVNSLLNMINYYPLCCNGQGVFQGIPWNRELNKIWDFEDNQLSLYESGIQRMLDYTDMYNQVVIINNQLEADTAPLYKLWNFELEGLSTHPFSYTNLGRYITKIFESDAVSQSYVDLRAVRELRKMLEVEEAISYNHMFATNNSGEGLPLQGDGFRFKNTLLNVDEIYRIISQSWNLKVGQSIKSIIRRVKQTNESI